MHVNHPSSPLSVIHRSASQKGHISKPWVQPEAKFERHTLSQTILSNHTDLHSIGKEENPIS